MPRPRKFQSTLPRGERLSDGITTRAALRFQSTLPRGERRPGRPRPEDPVRISIHAPARGATPGRPRPEDPVRISIHAPARGATSIIPRVPPFCKYFNPRSREGSDRRLLPGFWSAEISIHAPARGATFIILRPCQHVVRFQSTLPRGERHTAYCNLAIGNLAFQSTLPRGERLVILTVFFTSELISIHAPARGATAIEKTVEFVYGDFNPRSREGSDWIVTCGE